MVKPSDDHTIATPIDKHNTFGHDNNATRKLEQLAANNDHDKTCHNRVYNDHTSSNQLTASYLVAVDIGNHEAGHNRYNNFNASSDNITASHLVAMDEQHTSNCHNDYHDARKSHHNDACDCY